MTTRNVMITSKNQITLPADIVRGMRLGTNRRLRLRTRNGEIILKPEPELEERLQEIWAQLPPLKGTANDKQLRQTTKEAWGNKAP